MAEIKKNPDDGATGRNARGARREVVILSVFLPLQITVLLVLLVFFWRCVSVEARVDQESKSPAVVGAVIALPTPTPNAATASVTSTPAPTPTPAITPAPASGPTPTPVSSAVIVKSTTSPEKQSAATCLTGLKALFRKLCAGEGGMLIVVILSGALGASVHAANSFVGYVGSRSFVCSWFYWYMQRSLIGAGLSVMVYAALRGGLMTSAASGKDVNLFGFAAIGLLTGMFNKQAISKLTKVADALFTSVSDGKDPFAGKPTMAVTGIQPDSGPAGVDLALKVLGHDFTADCLVVIGDTPIKPVAWTPQSLDVIIPAAQMKAGAVLTVWVVTGPNGLRSAAQFTVTVK